MRLLVIDHYFGQDIEALERSAAGTHSFVRVSAGYFAAHAERYLPKAIWDGDMNEFWHARYEKHRQRWRTVARRVLAELRLVAEFDVIVSPSDTIFYLRAVIDAARELAIPVMVVQKETVISPGGMTELVPELRLFPLVADHMIVCSERHRDFWVAVGVNPSLVTVAGQARFDYYKHPEWWPPRGELDPVPLPDRRVILLFSYDLNIYGRLEDVYAGRPIWSELRAETEEVLVALARAGRHQVFVKPHPQQVGADLVALEARLASLAGDAWRRTVHLLSPAADARRWVVHSDVVVGFQTTALLEALLAGKRVIYTYWTPQAHERADVLIPYHLHGDALVLARSKQELEDAIVGSDRPGLDPAATRRLLEEHLGPCEGQACRRVFDEIARLVAGYPAPTAAQLARRAALDGRRASRLRRATRRAWVRWQAWRFLGWVFLSLDRFLGLEREWRWLRATVERRRRRLAECRQVSSDPGNVPREIAGDYPDGLFDLLAIAFMKLASRRPSEPAGQRAAWTVPTVRT